MLCQNCGKNEADIKYTQIINGVKKQMSLCDKCAQELGIEEMNFSMPISLSNFFGDMFNMYEDTNSILKKPEVLICNKCNMTYDEFIKTGKFGCDNCYNIFKPKLDLILKNIHGANRHIGRNGKKYIKNNEPIDKIETNRNKEKNEKIEKLQERLKKEIKEERYEDAAKTRDEIRNCQKGRIIFIKLT